LPVRSYAARLVRRKLPGGKIGKRLKDLGTRIEIIIISTCVNIGRNVKNLKVEFVSSGGKELNN